jgi:hypothetical protein
LRNAAIECSETLAYKLQTPGNHPEESTLQTASLFTLTLLTPEERSSLTFDGTDLLSRNDGMYIPFRATLNPNLRSAVYVINQEVRIKLDIQLTFKRRSADRFI